MIYLPDGSSYMGPGNRAESAGWMSSSTLINSICSFLLPPLWPLGFYFDTPDLNAGHESPCFWEHICCVHLFPPLPKPLYLKVIDVALCFNAILLHVCTQRRGISACHLPQCGRHHVQCTLKKATLLQDNQWQHSRCDEHHSPGHTPKTIYILGFLMHHSLP